MSGFSRFEFLEREEIFMVGEDDSALFAAKQHLFVDS
jgi:hypothetical protein